MVKIWRVENNKSEGCYWKQPTEIILKNHDIDGIHPLPYRDVGIERPPKHNEISGFIDKKQAMNWFNQNELDLLLAFDFRLKEVEVTKITATGQRQVLSVR